MQHPRFTVRSQRIRLAQTSAELSAGLEVNSAVPRPVLKLQKLIEAQNKRRKKDRDKGKRNDGLPQGEMESQPDHGRSDEDSAAG